MPSTLLLFGGVATGTEVQAVSPVDEIGLMRPLAASWATLDEEAMWLVAEVVSCLGHPLDGGSVFGGFAWLVDAVLWFEGSVLGRICCLPEPREWSLRSVWGPVVPGFRFFFWNRRLPSLGKIAFWPVGARCWAAAKAMPMW